MENKILRIITEFNFGFLPIEELMTLFEEFSVQLTDLNLKNYSEGGWREKLLFSFFVAYKRKGEFLEYIYNDLEKDINAKYLKGYLLAILVLTQNKQEDIERLKKIKNNPKLFSPQQCWILSAIFLLTENQTEISLECQKIYYKLSFAKNLIEKNGSVTIRT